MSDKQKSKKDREILELAIKLKFDNPKIKEKEAIKILDISEKQYCWLLRAMKYPEAATSIIAGRLSLCQAYKKYNKSEGTGETITTDVLNEYVISSPTPVSVATIIPEIMSGNEETKAEEVAVKKNLNLPIINEDRQGELTSNEVQIYDECKKTIVKFGDEFMQVGYALMTIRNGKLYRQTHKTFDKFCQSELPFSGRRAMQLADAAEVNQNLNDRSQFKILPSCEWQIRPLMKLKDADSQVAAWNIVNKKCPDGKVTESIVSKSVAEILISKGIKKSPVKPKEKSNSAMESIRLDLLLEIFKLANEAGKNSLPVHRVTLTSAVSAIPSDKMDTVVEGLDPEEMSFISSCIPKESK